MNEKMNTKPVGFFNKHVGDYVLCNNYVTGIYIKNYHHAEALYLRQTQGLRFRKRKHRNEVW